MNHKKKTLTRGTDKNNRTESFSHFLKTTRLVISERNTPSIDFPNFYHDNRNGIVQDTQRNKH